MAVFFLFFTVHQYMALLDNVKPFGVRNAEH